MSRSASRSKVLWFNKYRTRLKKVRFRRWGCTATSKERAGRTLFRASSISIWSSRTIITIGRRSRVRNSAAWLRSAISTAMSGWKTQKERLFGCFSTTTMAWQRISDRVHSLSFLVRMTLKVPWMSSSGRLWISWRSSKVLFKSVIIRSSKIHWWIANFTVEPKNRRSRKCITAIAYHMARWLVIAHWIYRQQTLKPAPTKSSQHSQCKRH